MSSRLSLSRKIEPTDPVEALLEAVLPPAEAHGQGDTKLAESLMFAGPERSGTHIWVAAATGNLEAVRRFLEDDAGLATAEGGTRGWDALLYLCFSKFLRTDDTRAASMLEIAELLLDAGADANTCWIEPGDGTGNRETALYGAAGIANHVALAKLLIERGADPNDGETAYHMVEHTGVPCADVVLPKLIPLHRGIALGHMLDYDDYDGLCKLLRLGAEPDGPTPFGNWPIHQAVFRGRDPRFFDRLLEHGADVDKPNGQGRTAYAMAARSGKKEIMGWLAAAGASIELEPTDAFIAACAAGDRQRAEQTLQQQPDLLEKLSERDRAEICEAADTNNTDGVRTMLDLGWDVNTRGPVWGETAAHRAAMQGHVETFKLAVERGADLTIPDRQYKSTALGWAQYGRQPKIIEHLRGLGDRLDLWDAIELGLTDRALALLGDVDPNAAHRGAGNGVFLRLASGHGNRPVVEALLRRGADPTIKTDYGVSAIDVAREQGHVDIAKLLEKANP